MNGPADPLESALADPARREVLQVVAAEMDRLFEIWDAYNGEHDAQLKNRRWNNFGSFSRRTMKLAMRQAERGAS